MVSKTCKPLVLVQKISDLTKLYRFYIFSVSKSHLKFIFLFYKDQNVSFTHSVTQSVSQSLTQSAKSIFKSTHTFRTYQDYHPCYSFNVPYLKIDLTKQIFGLLTQNLHYRNLPESPSEYQSPV